MLSILHIFGKLEEARVACGLQRAQPDVVTWQAGLGGDPGGVIDAGLGEVAIGVLFVHQRQSAAYVIDVQLGQPGFVTRRGR